MTGSSIVTFGSTKTSTRSVSTDVAVGRDVEHAELDALHAGREHRERRRDRVLAHRGIHRDVVVDRVVGEVVDDLVDARTLSPVVAEPPNQINRVAHSRPTIMTGGGNVTLQLGELRSKPVGDGRYARRHRRGVELPDRAAGRDHRRDGGAGDGGGARRIRAQTLRSLNGVFAGPVRARTRRDRGRGAAPGSIDVAAAAFAPQPGRRRPASTRWACSAPSAKGFTFTDAAVPEGVPRRSSARRTAIRSPTTSPATEPWFNFWEQVEGRPRSGTRRGTTTNRFRRCAAPGTASTIRPAPTTAPGTRYAVLALCDTMPGAVGERLGNSDRDAPRGCRRAPTSRVHMLDVARGDWVLAVNRARHAGDGYASADMEMWDLDGPEPQAGGLRHPDHGVQLPEIGLFCVPK